jgi:hypothetical protein
MWRYGRLPGEVQKLRDTLGGGGEDLTISCEPYKKFRNLYGFPIQRRRKGVSVCVKNSVT